jgi:hypothetical protein
MPSIAFPAEEPGFERAPLYVPMISPPVRRIEATQPATNAIAPLGRDFALSRTITATIPHGVTDVSNPSASS